ncbi:MAG: biotin-dependent carboxyltransferase family protein, partial [Micromonosporaceae bacterium]
MGERLLVHRAGWATVQDLGRPNVSGHGVSANGALDQYSARAANALVGQGLGEPLIEMTALPFACSVSCELTIAVTGADADLRVNGSRVAMWHPIRLSPGDLVELSDIRNGLRCYLAVRAKLQAHRFLGSVAPDPALGFGWHLAAGDEVPLTASPGRPYADPLTLSRLKPRYGSPWTLQVCAGPEWDAFQDVRDQVLDAEYTVDVKSNHVGIRLTGPVPECRMPPELSSRGVAIGAVEMTPSRELVLLHRGRSITAGYPIIAVVTTASLSPAGQLRPGDRVRFDICSIESAVHTHLRQLHVLKALAHQS